MSGWRANDGERLAACAGDADAAQFVGQERIGRNGVAHRQRQDDVLRERRQATFCFSEGLASWGLGLGRAAGLYSLWRTPDGGASRRMVAADLTHRASQPPGAGVASPGS